MLDPADSLREDNLRNCDDLQFDPSPPNSPKASEPRETGLALNQIGEEALAQYHRACLKFGSIKNGSVLVSLAKRTKSSARHDQRRKSWPM